MDQALSQLVDKLQKAYGDRLVSIVLYGSAAAGDHHPKFSDYNVLCVLTAITPAELAAGEPIFRWWREHGSPSPLLLSEREVATSADSFAIEFRDMQRSRQVLFGQDVIAPLTVETVFYRAQVEHDLRAKLLRLRQKAAGMLSQSDLLRRLLVDSLSTFCVLFRHALILHGIDAPVRKRETITQAAERFGFAASPFEQILEVREERRKPRDVDAVALLSGYLEGIGVVIDAVDRLEK
jgi:hypothetical protein